MYIFLQQYWWLVVSLLGAILVFLLFVQGGNSLLFCLGKTEEHRKMMVNSTGRITGMQACVFVHDGCRKIQRGAQKAAE